MFHKSLSSHLTLLVGTAACLANYSAAGTVYVDLSAPNNGDGLSWATAYTSVQEALGNVASGDEIWVRQGLYEPMVPVAGSDSSGYLLVDGVGIYGGFNGSETLRSQRDPDLNVTTLSGGGSTSVHHIFEGHAVGPNTIIDGIVIANGSAGDDAIGGVGGAGGGFLLLDSSPTIANCTIRDCATRIGSGVYVQDGSPSFDNCIFTSNNSVRSGEGGAIYSIVTNLGQTQTLDVTDCDFIFNSVRQGHWATGNGGAIFTGVDVVLTVLNSTFDNNSGWHNGTFGNAVVGGAIAILGDGAYIENCSFNNGYTNIGGGIYSAGDIEIIQCSFWGNRAVIAGTCGGFDCPSDVPDIASGFGGAVFVNSFATATIDQCTFSSNYAAHSGGGAVAPLGIIRNSVLWGNTSPQPCCNEDPLPVSRMQYEGADVEYSVIEGLLTPQLGEDPPNPNNFPGSNEDDPLFVDAVAGDLRLLSGSSAIDAGNNALVLMGMLTDLNGDNRFVDDLDTPDTGPSAAPVVDMGAYEHQSAGVCLADLTGDGELNFFDVSAFLAAFSAGDSIADFSGDGQLNFFDVSSFLAQFAAGCP